MTERNKPIIFPCIITLFHSKFLCIIVMNDNESDKFSSKYSPPQLVIKTCAFSNWSVSTFPPSLYIYSKLQLKSRVTVSFLLCSISFLFHVSLLSESDANMPAIYLQTFRIALITRKNCAKLGFCYIPD